MDRRSLVGALLAFPACGWASGPAKPAAPPASLTPAIADLPVDPDAVTPLDVSEDRWRALLDPFAYQVLREEGTERAFTGRYWDLHDAGTYLCAGCGLGLFASADKFDSGTGWPSFTKPIRAGRVTERSDVSHGMTRVELSCARCGGHQGHVFPDGPRPTGMRYCINSVSLIFRPA
jgi:peptide-methionine (R)-S-oxide reductase